MFFNFALTNIAYICVLLFHSFLSMFNFEAGETLLFDKPKGWSSFDLVKRGSTYNLNAFALATVVAMRLCRIKELAIFANIALR